MRSVARAGDIKFALTPIERDRFDRAIAAIDAANSSDPNWIVVRGLERPKELAHAELASEWVEVLRPHASVELRIAARAHHIRRWEIPRLTFPAGRSGYLRWRRRLQIHHAEQTGIVLAGEGYPEDTILRVQVLIRKQGRNAESRTFEDALCLTFLETQFGDFTKTNTPEKVLDVTRKTLAKMTPRAIRHALDMPLAAPDRALLERALHRDF